VTRWEHLIVAIPGDAEEDLDAVRRLLDHYGEDGWELVTYNYRPLVDIHGGTGLSNIMLGAGARVDATYGDSFAIFKRQTAS
jgi:hypothetical protein